MKICAIICEYNPFHNGHKYLIEQAKSISGCDFALCLMSGSFTQRGEPAILDKFTRAKHAVMGGADCVLQLPVCFSVAPAEIFALGAIKILSSLPDVKYLAFGCENANKDTLLKCAEQLANESAQFKAALKKQLDKGNSYKIAIQSALSLSGGGKFISSPNNVLAAEYAKAIIKLNADIEIIPVQRLGAEYGDARLKDSYSSASAIRANLTDRKIKENVPPFVFKDLENLPSDKEVRQRNDSILRYALLRSSRENLRSVHGCTEGLENKLKELSHLPAEQIIEQCTNKRYSSSRIMRILTANALGLSSDLSGKFLQNVTYLKPLAVRKKYADKILAALAKSGVPLIIKKNSLRALSQEGLKLYEKDKFADSLRDIIYMEQTYDFTILTV